MPPDDLERGLRRSGYGTGYRELPVSPGGMLDLGEVPLHAPSTLRLLVLSPEQTPLEKERVLIFPIHGWVRPEEPRRSMAVSNSEGSIAIKADAGRYQAIAGGREGWGLVAFVWEHGREPEEDSVVRLPLGFSVELRFAQTPDVGRRLVLLDEQERLLSRSWMSSEEPWPLTLAPSRYLVRVEDLERNYIATLDLIVPVGGGELTVTLP